MFKIKDFAPIYSGSTSAHRWDTAPPALDSFSSFIEHSDKADRSTEEAKRTESNKGETYFTYFTYYKDSGLVELEAEIARDVLFASLHRSFRLPDREFSVRSLYGSSPVDEMVTMVAESCVTGPRPP